MLSFLLKNIKKEKLATENSKLFQKLDIIRRKISVSPQLLHCDWNCHPTKLGKRFIANPHDK